MKMGAILVRSFLNAVIRDVIVINPIKHTMKDNMYFTVDMIIHFIFLLFKILY